MFGKVIRRARVVLRDSGMSSDDALERLKRRRMLEMQKRMLLDKAKNQSEEKTEQPVEPTTEETLYSYLTGRAPEVMDAARNQFPQVISQVEEVLVDAIKKGSIKNKIDGESLFQFFRQIGLPVRLQTTIRYKDHGELKTISQRLKEKN